MTRRKVTIVAATIALGLGNPAVSFGYATETAVPQRDMATRLAETVLPSSAILAVRIPRFSAAYAEELKDDARIAGLEKTYPGITEIISVVARAEAVKAYRQALDLLQRDAAQIYRDAFAPAELQTLKGFFDGPTGQAMIAMSAESSGPSPTSFEADRRAKAIAYLQNIDDAGKRDLKSLIDSGLLPKVRAINPKIAALSSERFDDAAKFIDAALPARIEEVVARATGKPKP